MSVRQGDRQQGKLQVLDLSRNLTKYSITACKNEKIFPKSQRWIMSQRIVNEAIDATTCIRRANATYVNDEQTYKYRRGEQLKAHASLNALLTLIDIAYDSFDIETRKIAFWTKLVVDTDEKLKTWMKSDKERYIKQFAES